MNNNPEEFNLLGKLNWIWTKSNRNLNSVLLLISIRENSLGLSVGCGQMIRLMRASSWLLTSSKIKLMCTIKEKNLCGCYYKTLNTLTRQSRFLSLGFQKSNGVAHLQGYTFVSHKKFIQSNANEIWGLYILHLAKNEEFSDWRILTWNLQSRFVRLSNRYMLDIFIHICRIERIGMRKKKFLV